MFSNYFFHCQLLLMIIFIVWTDLNRRYVIGRARKILAHFAFHSIPNSVRKFGWCFSFLLFSCFLHLLKVKWKLANKTKQKVFTIISKWNFTRKTIKLKRVASEVCSYNSCSLFDTQNENYQYCLRWKTVRRIGFTCNKIRRVELLCDFSMLLI